MTTDFLSDAVMAAAFPSHALVGAIPTLVGACTDYGCPCRSWAAAGTSEPAATVAGTTNPS
jgi:hypothetical protein